MKGDIETMSEQRKQYLTLMKELYQEGIATCNGLTYEVNQIEENIEIRLANGQLLDIVRTPREVWETVLEQAENIAI